MEHFHAKHLTTLRDQVLQQGNTRKIHIEQASASYTKWMDILSSHFHCKMLIKIKLKIVCLFSKHTNKSTLTQFNNLYPVLISSQQNCNN